MEFVPRKPKATNLLLKADFMQLFEYNKMHVLHILFCLFLERDECAQEAVDMNRTEFKRPTRLSKRTGRAIGSRHGKTPAETKGKAE